MSVPTNSNSDAKPAVMKTKTAFLLSFLTFLLGGVSFTLLLNALGMIKVDMLFGAELETFPAAAMSVSNPQFRRLYVQIFYMQYYTIIHIGYA
jgi:hypothetical protein